jgi:hypothetical protein
MFYRNIKRSGDLVALLSGEEAAKQALVAPAEEEGRQATDSRPVVFVEEPANMSSGAEKKYETVVLTPSPL